MSIYQFFLCIHRYRQKYIVTVTSTCHSLQAAEPHGKRGNRGKPGEKRPGPATFEDHGQEELIMQMQQSRSQAEGWTNRQTWEGTRNPSKQTNKSLLSAVTRVVCVTFSARWRCPNKKWKKKTVFTGHEYIKQHTSTLGVYKFSLQCQQIESGLKRNFLWLYSDWIISCPVNPPKVNFIKGK